MVNDQGLADCLPTLAGTGTARQYRHFELAGDLQGNAQIGFV
jgi:hypothetical protein